MRDRPRGAGRTQVITGGLQGHTDSDQQEVR